MTQNENGGLNVLSMMHELSETTSVEEADLFRRNTPAAEAPVTSEPEPEIKDDPFADPPIDARDLPTYTAEQIAEGNEKPKLESLIDDQAKEAGNSQLSEMGRAHSNIEAAKKRLGIKYLNIPTIYTSRVIDCAASEDPTRSGADIDALLTEIITTFPDAVVEWAPNSALADKLNIVNAPMVTTPANSGELPAETTDDDPEAPVVSQPESVGGDNVTVVIDKTQAPELSFTPEELEKIKRSRSVELKIVENRNINYAIIDEPVDDIATVLSQYTRKFNDRAVSLPASRYRCTVTGLSYPEIMDTYYTLKENSGIDSEMRKWSIAYDHIKNPSIGPFADFDDFLQKTSYLDINYIIWNILCASSMAKEIVSLDCQRDKCGNTYEWVYSPESLLRVEEIPSFLLEEMKITGEANGTQAIMDHYNGSMMRLGNSIELPSSHFVIAFGHVSAYAYLREGIFAMVDDAAKSETPSYLELVEAGVMSSLKYFLLPKNDASGKYYRISDREQMKQIIHGLDEIDFQTLGKLTDMMTDPYAMTFSIKDAVCSKCKHRSDVSIKNIVDLLFIISRSLETANVVLKN